MMINDFIDIGESIVPRQHQQPILHQYFKQNQQQRLQLFIYLIIKPTFK
jgi:hypothetical protein